MSYQVLSPSDQTTHALIAQWYLSEWNIPEPATIQKLESFTPSGDQFQVIMTLDNTPIATGGIYHHVGLHHHEPRFKVHPHWLALVYTLPQYRGKGYGAMLCHFIEQHAKNKGLKELYLFTHTAESLYTRLNWQLTERYEANGKNMAIMKKDL